MPVTINADTITGAAVVTADASGVLSLQGAGNTGISISATGVATLGDGNEIGFRVVPRSGSAKTSSYTLALADRGDFIEVGSGGSITIPNAVFSTGDVVSIFNNTSGSVTITCSITTAYKAGTDADQATVTLETRGVATVLFISGTVCVISGNLA